MRTIPDMNRWVLVTLPNGNVKALCPRCGTLCIVEFCGRCWRERDATQVGDIVLRYKGALDALAHDGSDA